jgi:photosystem II stability/assembly factor-like uncharacterized protein
MKNKILLPALFILIIHSVLNTDNCMSQWMQMSNGMGNNMLIKTIVTNGNNIFAGGYYGVYKSTNNGLNWIQTDSVPPNNIIETFATKDNFIFAGNYGIYYSTNEGNNWIQGGLNNMHIISLAVKENYLLAGTAPYHGIWFTTNNGLNWVQTSINNKNVWAFAVNGNNIYAGIDNYPSGSGGVWHSTDNGQNWTQIFYNNSSVQALAINGANIFAGEYNNIFSSTNEGLNWTQVAGFSESVQSIAINGNNIIAGVFGTGIYFSSNNGTNWILRNQGFSSLSQFYSLLITNNYIYVGTEHSVWRRLYTDILGINEIYPEIPTDYSLSQNYPNPFNPVTNIKYQLTNNKYVSIKVFDILGKEIRSLVNEKQTPGTYEVSFDGSNLTSGIYFYSLFGDGVRVETKKMILLK